MFEYTWCCMCCCVHVISCTLLLGVLPRFVLKRLSGIWVMFADLIGMLANSLSDCMLAGNQSIEYTIA